MEKKSKLILDTTKLEKEMIQKNAERIQIEANERVKLLQNEVQEMKANIKKLAENEVVYHSNINNQKLELIKYFNDQQKSLFNLHKAEFRFGDWIKDTFLRLRDYNPEIIEETFIEPHCPINPKKMKEDMNS